MTEICEDRAEDASVKVTETYSKDSDARWIKKGGKPIKRINHQQMQCWLKAKKQGKKHPLQTKKPIFFFFLEKKMA